MTPQQIAEARAQREELENRLTELTADSTREVSADDAAEIIRLQDEITELSSNIEEGEKTQRARMIAVEHRRKIDRSHAARSNRDDVETAGQRFSWTKFIRESLNGKHEGLEAEIRQEGFNEARDFKHMDSPTNPLPSQFLQIRATSQETSTAGRGQETIDEQLGSLIPALRPRLALARLGATQMTGLTSPIRLPRHVGLPNAAWRGEEAAATQTYATFDDIDLKPHGLSAWVDFTRELAFQSSISVENFIREELGDAIRRKYDSTALIGDGNSDDPVGLLNIVGTNDASIGGGGATPDWADVVNFWKELAVDNADFENMSFLTNPLVAHALMTTPKVSGTDSQMLLDSPTGRLGGYPIFISNQVPSDLTDTVHENQSALIFGNWKEAIVAQWGGIDVVVDPITVKKQAIVEVVVHSWWDFNVKHPASFAIAKDIGGTEVSG